MNLFGKNWINGFLTVAALSCTVQALANEPAKATSATAPNTTNTAAAAASNAAPEKFNWGGVPPVTPMPRPGLFTIPPAGPGYFSLWDLISGNKRETAPVAPYAPFALLPTSAFDIDFRYLEKPDHEKDVFDPFKRIKLADNWMLSFGGQFWYRYMHETDSRLNAGGRIINIIFSVLVFMLISGIAINSDYLLNSSMHARWVLIYPHWPPIEIIPISSIYLLTLSSVNLRMGRYTYG